MVGHAGKGETPPDEDWPARYRPEIDTMRAALEWAPGVRFFYELSSVAEAPRSFEKLVSIIGVVRLTFERRSGSLCEA